MGKNLVCSWIGRCNIVMMSMLPKMIRRFNTNPIRIPRFCFFFLSRNRKANPQAYMGLQMAPSNQNNLEKEE